MPDQAATPLVGVTRDGASRWLTMRRPPANKLDLALTRQLLEALVRADADSEVRAIVLTGSDGVFCAGADVPAITATDTLHEFADTIVELFGVFPELTTPVIAAVNGDALAGGFGLLCCADIVVALDTAAIGTVEAQYGSWPVIAQVAALRRTPFPALLRNALTGVPFSAEHAARLGVVDEVVTAADLTGRVQELAAAVMSGGDTVAVGRPDLYRARNLPYREALRQGADHFIAFAEGTSR